MKIVIQCRDCGQDVPWEEFNEDLEFEHGRVFGYWPSYHDEDGASWAYRCPSCRAIKGEAYTLAEMPPTG